MWLFKRVRKKTEIEDLKNQIHTLNQLLESKKQPIEYHFHINQIDIHDPTLEELNFKLDQIDIEDLSGALNVGNNFGVTVKDRKNKKKCGSDDSEMKAKATKNGYSFSFNSKEE
ncbi:hypothetical protein ACTWQL_15770 [Pseudalkalibacillus sp. R45]|uniref:hypothetical protein n=1 Tax=Pseudalkalibacillus sp. R45 TaxID=3457433 RepID=UPI003FCD9E3C